MNTWRPTMVLSHEPADKLFIDFAGKQLDYTDRNTGGQISCQVFVACLPFSDYAFAMVVPSQRLEDFLHALGCCLSYMGGVPKALVPDNLKSAIIRSSRYEPELNRALADFANHYDTVVVPARVRKPRDKALVENQVKNIYTRVFARLRHRQFFDMASLNQAITELMKVHNQTRMQQKPYCREERFLAAEKHLLGELPAEAFQLKYYPEAKVAHNGHIYLGESITFRVRNFLPFTSTSLIKSTDQLSLKRFDCTKGSFTRPGSRLRASLLRFKPINKYTLRTRL